MHKISAILILPLLLASCSALAPTPTPTQTPIPTATLTSTPIPTNTLEPTATATSEPTATETPSQPMLALPSGTPIKEWKGIPIMPGALAGEEDEESYIFTIAATVPEVQAYYEKEMAALGWELMTPGMDSDDAVMLIFNNNKPPLLPISITRQGDVTIVLMVSSQ